MRHDEKGDLPAMVNMELEEYAHHMMDKLVTR